MKHNYFLVSVVAAIVFLLPGIVLAEASPSDLNTNGINDSEEEEVRIESGATLLPGEYDFKNLIIANGATLLLKGDPDSADAFKGVKINALNVTVEAGSSISADLTGYRAYTGPGTPSEDLYYAGASYGGKGDRNTAGSRYGSATHPTDLGTGGGGPGGGAMWIVVSGIFTNNGSLSANGQTSASGGSIYIVAQTLSGNGKFSANGGGISPLTYSKGMGGGGRIALYYGSSAFTGTAEAKGGCGSYDGWSRQCAENGTVGFFDTTNNDFLSGPSWRFQASDGPFTFNNIVFDNSSVILENGADVMGDTLHMDHTSAFTLEGGEMHVAHIGLDGRSTMTLGGNILKATTLAVVGDSTVTTAPEKKIDLEIGDIQVSADSVISADATGYPQNTGPGAPRTEIAGASYGGAGSGNPPDSVYGSADEPVDFGSGGGAYFGHGGGAIRIITNYLLNNGTISANGTETSSGGSIWVTVKDLSGSGTFKANGGLSYCPNSCFGPGGGGRVAIYYNTGLFEGTAEAKGVNMFGGISEAGTVIVKQTDAICTTCFSNVLFIPGLEASRLYQTRADGSEDQLWEPNVPVDIPDLYLNNYGNSIKDVYTRDVMSQGEIFGIKVSIYKSLLQQFDNLVATTSPNKMAQWRAYAYDWRQGIDDLVNNGTKYSTGALSLTEVLDELIKTSKTGKVTIIAHSNGGLLAKALIKKLQDDKIAGKNNYIDKIDNIILIASPQIGTPEGLFAILHGYDQKLPLKLMSEVQARQLALNMPSAYGLIPSSKYFNQSNVPVLAKFTPTMDEQYSTEYGETIDTYTEEKNFITGVEGRPQAPVDDLIWPAVGNTALLNQAETLHDTIDNIVVPDSIKVIEVAGWGKDTIGGMTYTGGDLQPIWTYKGDKTVVSASALYGNAEKYWLDLSHSKLEHKNITEDPDLLDFIQNILQRTALGNIVTQNQPSLSTSRLHLSVHSPITIGAYDVVGNFTGKVCNTNNNCIIQENIPGSTYNEFGEGKYVTLAEDDLKKVDMDGTGTGTFTFVFEKTHPDDTTEVKMFIDIPVTPETQATVTVNPLNNTPQLALDVTGDGTADFTLQPKTEFDPILFLQILKKTIDSFNLNKSAKNSLTKRIDTIITAIQKGKINKAVLKADTFKKYLQKRSTIIDKKDQKKREKHHRLTSAEVNEIIIMINNLLDNLK